MKFNELKHLFIIFEDLKHISRQLKKLNELECNTGLTQKQIEKREKLYLQTLELVEKIKNICTDEINIELSGDPRGAPIWLILNNYEDVIYI